MKKILLIAMLCMCLSGCAYNSRNVIYLYGKDMDFSYGLIAAKNISGLIILRETNSGDGEVKNHLPDLEKYLKAITK